MTAADSAGADRYLECRGARLRFRDEGRGPPVLLVHGWALDLEAWDLLIPSLLQSFRVVRLDRRGFGGSSGHPGVREDALDLLELCEQLRLDRVALIAHSQGVRCALDLACEHPERVTCLVLDGPPELDPAHAAANLSLEPLRELARTAGLMAMRRAWLQNPLMRLHCAGAPARALLEEIVRRYPARDLLEPPGEAPADLFSRAPSMRISTLVVTGELDLPERRRAADALARQLPFAERAEVPASGHLPVLDNPQAYTARVIPFIVGHTPVPRV